MHCLIPKEDHQDWNQAVVNLGSLSDISVPAGTPKLLKTLERRRFATSWAVLEES
jgi:hypothetical protein